MVDRQLKIQDNHSFFLFGPRGTGKSTWLRHHFSSDSVFTLDLLDLETEHRILSHPGAFRQMIDALPPLIRWVIVDEIQKVPNILNEIHRQIETVPNRYFAMTGSSARKLKYGQSNLLAGRALTYHLGALTSQELGKAFNLDTALAMGTLPSVACSTDTALNQDYLRAYANTYLKEEIQAEGVTRNLPAFRRFLNLAAFENGNVISWENIASEVGIDAKTTKSYFQILEDTLIGIMLPPYHRSLRKQQGKRPKFYFFDTGVSRALAGTLTVPLIPGTTEYGRAFEQFWITQYITLNQYYRLDYRFSFLATPRSEIDLVIEKPDSTLIFVEFKSSHRVNDSELRTLNNLVADVPNSKGICVCREPFKRKTGNSLICPWKEALTELGFSQ